MENHQRATDSIFNPPGSGAAASRPQAGQFWIHLAGKLRGRYLLLVSLMLLAGALGAAGGWLHGKRLYRSEGIVVLSTDAPKLSDTFTGPPADAERFAETEVSLITERPVIEGAMRTDAWRNLLVADKPETPEEFAVCLVVERPPGDETIHIYFTYPDAKVAGEGVRALMQSYEADFHLRQSKQEATDISALQSERAKVSANLNDADSKIDQIITKYGSDDLEIIETTKLQVWQEYERRASELNSALVLASSSTAPADIIAKLTPMQISMVDPRMSRLLDNVDALEQQLQRCVGLGPNHPMVIDTRTALEDERKRVEDYAENFRAVQSKMLANPQVDAQQSSSANIMDSFMRNSAEIREKQQQFAKLAESMKAEWTSVAQAKREVQKIHEQRGMIAVQLTDLDRRLTAISVQKQISGTLDVVSYGDSPAPFYKDKRLAWAIVGAVFGMSIPFLLLTFVALRDNRYRYSDEADNAGDPSRPPLLGILPVIPDTVTDPEQAAVVAHCVHQVRVMLQLENQPGKSQTYMVTSGTAGDGKTSLTIALGVSFAKSGARTLLIDGDMIGRGLTSRLATRAEPEKDAVAVSGGLGSVVQRTDVPNLFLLPLPAGASADAAGLSPNSIKDLLQQARSKFDAVLIDTGPVLGSIEASVIAGAVDGVILAISRGQQRVLVNRALRHLRSSGANIMGMVFNRAERRDFHRSVASTSIRSIAATERPQRALPGNGQAPSRMGPLAACVATPENPSANTAG